MARARAQLVDPQVTSYYHCMSRCVRRAFLCGNDRYSGRSFDHRKAWIAERMKELVEIFAIDVCAYGLMSNHFHLILRLVAAAAASWTDEEVVTRYEKIFPRAVANGRLLPPARWTSIVGIWRERLTSLSWFMRALNESIARRANREDNVTGRFWEGRFRSQALLDVGALLTCMTYVDLNPIRAGLADTLEDSDFTSIRERLLAAARPAGETSAVCPEGLLPFFDQVQGGSGVEPLPATFVDYVEMLKWTADAYRNRANVVPPPAVIERIGLDPTELVETMRSYPRRFFTMVGETHRIDLEAKRRGYRRRPGIGASQRLYRARAA